MIDFGLLQNGQNSFQNALARGMRAGAAVGDFMQGRQEAKQRNALAAYAANPTREGIAGIAQASPEFAIQERGRFDQQDRQSRLTEIGQRAAQGDPAALGELFQLDPDMWQRMDTRQRDQVKSATSYMAQSSMQIGRLPEEQRAAAWAQAVQQAEGGGMDIPPHLERYSPQALNGALATAEQTAAYIRQFEPDWKVIPEGGYLENVNQFPQQTQQPQQQPQQSGGQEITADMWRANTAAMSPQNLAGWVERTRPTIINRRGARVQTDVLNGQVAYLVDGVWYDNPEGQ